VGHEECRPMVRGQEINLRDVVRTGSDGQAVIKIASGGGLQLFQNSRLYFMLRGKELITVLEAGQAQIENLASALSTSADAEKTLQSSSGSLIVTRTEKGLRTESKKGAEVILANGSRVKLTGGVEINEQELNEEFQLIMLDGEVEVDAKPGTRKFKMLMGEASLLVMEAGRGKFLKDDEGTRVEMIIGEAVVEREGERQIVKAGTAYDMRVGRVELLRREELATIIKEGQKAARIRSAGEKRFRAPRTGEKIIAGSELEVRGTGRVVLLEGNNRLELSPGTRARFLGAFLEGKKRQGELELAQGELFVRLRRFDGHPVMQKVKTPLGEIEAEASGLTAQADIQVEKDQLQMVVHTGRAAYLMGEKKLSVLSGQRLVLFADGRQEGPGNLPLPPLFLPAGENCQIFYDRQPPALTFDIKASSQENGWLEISSRQDMSQLIISEPLSPSPFGYRLLGSGSFYWRWRKQDETPPPTLVVIRPDPLLVSARSSVVNEVRDTGVETKIIFQGRVPALRFLWDRPNGAAWWLFRLYHGDRLEKPLLEQKTTSPRLDLEPGKLAEGAYFWYQAGYDQQGKLVHQSQMNKLVLQFDNAALLLRIESPVPGEAPSGGRVLVKGQAAEGSRLSANGKPVALDSKWRFEQMLGGVKPGGVVVFHLQKKGLADTYFVRHLGK